jgi:hypothetical protein
VRHDSTLVVVDNKPATAAVLWTSWYRTVMAVSGTSIGVVYPVLMGSIAEHHTQHDRTKSTSLRCLAILVVNEMNVHIRSLDDSHRYREMWIHTFVMDQKHVENHDRMPGDEAEPEHIPCNRAFRLGQLAPVQRDTCWRLTSASRRETG